jgi:hypothetical protein
MVCNSCGTPIPSYPCYRCGRVGLASRPSPGWAGFGAALALALSGACGGGGGGGSISGPDPADSAVAQLAGAWSLAGSLARGEEPPCLELGLQAATLELQLLHALLDEDTYVGIYEVAAAGWDTESLAVPGESCLTAVALMDDKLEPLFFLDGLYYDAARDETVEVSTELLPLPTLLLEGGQPVSFELVARYERYSGYQIAIVDSSLPGFDDDDDGEVDEPDEVDLGDGIEPGFAGSPDCAGEIHLVGTATTHRASLVLQLIAAGVDEEGRLAFPVYAPRLEAAPQPRPRACGRARALRVARDALQAVRLVWAGAR